MLKLTRAKGEKLFIGPDIVVEFCGFNRDGEAIIGVAAPRSIKVYREELAQQIAADVECKNAEERKKRKEKRDEQSD